MFSLEEIQKFAVKRQPTGIIIDTNLLILYLILRYVEKRTPLRLMAFSIAFAAALTTKVTAIIFLPLILYLILYQNRKNVAQGLIHVLKFSLLLILFSFILK